MKYSFWLLAFLILTSCATTRDQCEENDTWRVRGYQSVDHCVQAVEAYRAQLYLQMQAQRQPAYNYQPMPVYQAPRTMQSNCQSAWIGGTLQTQCSSAPTGIDTSMYH